MFLGGCVPSQGYSASLGGSDLLYPCCRVTVTPDGTLIIRNISRSDEGKYTCFAENFMGKANSTGILSVRGKRCGWRAQPPEGAIPLCRPALVFAPSSQFSFEAPPPEYGFAWDHPVATIQKRVLPVLPHTHGAAGRLGCC